MKTVRTSKGPFTERRYFKPQEIEHMCVQALRGVGLLPQTPQPIRIDRFIEKHFKISHSYEDMPEGVLGFTRFGPNGVVEDIVLSTALEAGGNTKVNERRVRTTLAHEAGHGLMHAYLFAMGAKPASLFNDADTTPRILCRDVHDESKGHAGHSDRWWEFQANKAIGRFLMPRRLVELAGAEFASSVGSFGATTIEPSKREAAARALAEIFEVNPAVARIRIDEMFPLNTGSQLSF